MRTFRPVTKPQSDSAWIGGYRFRPTEKPAGSAVGQMQSYQKDSGFGHYYPPTSANAWESEPDWRGHGSPYGYGTQLKFRPLERTTRSRGRRWTGNYPTQPQQGYGAKGYEQRPHSPFYQNDPYGNWSRAPQAGAYSEWSRAREDYRTNF